MSCYKFSRVQILGKNAKTALIIFFTWIALNIANCASFAFVLVDASLSGVPGKMEARWSKPILTVGVKKQITASKKGLKKRQAWEFTSQNLFQTQTV